MLEMMMVLFFCSGKHDYIQSKPLSSFLSTQLPCNTNAQEWPRELGAHMSWVILALPSLPARPAHTTPTISNAQPSMTKEVNNAFSLWNRLDLWHWKKPNSKHPRFFLPYPRLSDESYYHKWPTICQKCLLGFCVYDIQDF